MARIATLISAPIGPMPNSVFILELPPVLSLGSGIFIPKLSDNSDLSSCPPAQTLVGMVHVNGIAMIVKRSIGAANHQPFPITIKHFSITIPIRVA